MTEIIFVLLNMNVDSPELIGTMIPCEYCGRQVIIDDYPFHTVKREEKKEYRNE